MEIFVKNVRLSFPDLFAASEHEGKIKYRATFMMPADDPQVAHVWKAIDAVGTEKFKDKWPALKKKAGDSNKEICFVTGKDESSEGMMCLRALRNVDAGRPIIIDRNTQPLVQEDGKPYSGCYVNAKVELWAQDNSNGKTVRCTLVAVQFVSDGESFGGAKVATADGFEVLPDVDPLAEPESMM